MMSQKLASVPGVEQLLLSRRGNGADVQGDLLQRKPLVQVHHAAEKFVPQLR